MDVDLSTSQRQLPGSDYDFHDVTNVFRDAAAAMHPADMLFMEGYGLLEAMSAIEIGEPRLDTGLVRDNENQTPFDPLAPLLPEEICWILDRAFACEMEWHTGRVLSHTVFTLVYIHELPALEPDFSLGSHPRHQDPLRPTELITVVLRAAVQGLLKCCDLSWRELSIGDMLDAEDWQSDKCEVSLLESLPSKVVISRLDEAISWVMRSTKGARIQHIDTLPMLTTLGEVPEDWRYPLGARLLLRKSLLQLFDCQTCVDTAQFSKLVEEVRRWLSYVQLYPAPELKPDSPAQRAFDPMIIRRLSTAVPVSRGPEPSVERAWNHLASLLDDLHDLCSLASTLSITSWEITGNLRVWSAGQRRRLPYARSLTQRTFYGGVLILHHFPFKWLVDRFFLESLDVPYDSILKHINRRWRKPDPVPIQTLERILFTLLCSHIKNHWSNPPRRRRYLMKSLVSWHRLYDLLLDITDNLKPAETPVDNALHYLPTIALQWRLSVIQEVIFSGFQLELYSPEEMPFAYCYLTQVIEKRLECLDNLMLVLPKSSPTYREYHFQRDFLTALQHMSMALLLITFPMMSRDWDTMRPTFYRRYKWAYKLEYDRIKTIPVPPPSLYHFMRTYEALSSKESTVSTPADMIRLAKLVLNQIIHDSSLGGWAASWTKDRAQFVQATLVSCERLEALPGTPNEMESFDIGLLKWDPGINPWFPMLAEEGSERRRKSYLRHSLVS